MVQGVPHAAGTLRAEVRQTEDWPWGDHVPFLDDFLSPRSRKFLVTGPAGSAGAALPARATHCSEEIAALPGRSQPAMELAAQHDLLLAGGWGVGADMFGWVYGLENMMFAMYDQPEFVQRDAGHHRRLEPRAAWQVRAGARALTSTSSAPGTRTGLLQPRRLAGVYPAHPQGRRRVWPTSTGAVRLPDHPQLHAPARDDRRGWRGRHHRGGPGAVGPGGRPSASSAARSASGAASTAT